MCTGMKRIEEMQNNVCFADNGRSVFFFWGGDTVGKTNIYKYFVGLLSLGTSRDVS